MSQIHFFTFLNFAIFRAWKKDRIRTIKVTDSDYALLREVRVLQPYMWFQVEPWIKSDKKWWKIVKIWSRTHVRELQLFAKNRQKKWCAKTFFARTWKKFWKSEKKLDQNSILFTRKVGTFKLCGSRERSEFENVFIFDSNLNQIWSPFFPFPLADLTNLKVSGLCRYIILNKAKSSNFKCSLFF